MLITGGVGTLVLGLVKGGSWGWGDPRTASALLVGVVSLALFALHVARSRNPLIERELFRLRPVTGASVVALLFMAAFGGMLLSVCCGCRKSGTGRRSRRASRSHPDRSWSRCSHSCSRGR